MNLFKRPALDNRYVEILISILIFICAYFLTAFRIENAPDIFTDEIIYSRVGLRVAGEGALVWDSGTPFLVHPPAYFLIEGLSHSFFGENDAPLYAPGDIFSIVMRGRLLNAFFSALTCVVLYWMGKSLYDKGLGFLLVALFLIDPFALRINRRAMLETMAMLMALGAFFLFWVDIKRNTVLERPTYLAPGIILAGLLMGIAFLTKELAFIFLLPIVIFTTWEYLHRQFQFGIFTLSNRNFPGKRKTLASQLWLPIKALITVAIALLTYSIYPLWILLSGDPTTYVSEKSLGLKRLLGLIQITGWNRPDISFVELLGERLNHYGSSYLILTLGGFALLGLMIWGRDRLSGRYLIAIGAVLYPFFAFITLFGSGNDQFFYFLLVPAILILGYSLVALPANFSSRAKHNQKIAFIYAGTTNMIKIALLLLVSFNAYQWYITYGVGKDDGYAQFTRYVEANLPADEPINASGDPIKFRYFLPDHPIFASAIPEEAVPTGVHYFVLAPKDVQMRYGRILPTLAEWIQANGKLLFSTRGSSYGDIYLYQVDYPDSGEQVTLVQSRSQQQGSRFQAAEGGHVTSLIILLIAWSMICAGIAVGITQFDNMTQYVKSRSKNAHWI